MVGRSRIAERLCAIWCPHCPGDPPGRRGVFMPDVRAARAAGPLEPPGLGAALRERPPRQALRWRYSATRRGWAGYLDGRDGPSGAIRAGCNTTPAPHAGFGLGWRCAARRAARAACSSAWAFRCSAICCSYRAAASSTVVRAGARCCKVISWTCARSFPGILFLPSFPLMRLTILSRSLAPPFGQNLHG